MKYLCEKYVYTHIYTLYTYTNLKIYPSLKSRESQKTLPGIHRTHEKQFFFLLKVKSIIS